MLNIINKNISVGKINFFSFTTFMGNLFVGITINRKLRNIKIIKYIKTIT
jgi:hypothetical protein